MGSTDSHAWAGLAGEPRWNDCPPGHVSISEGSRRTGFSPEWLRCLARTGRLDSIEHQIGSRTRIWLAEEGLRRLRNLGADRRLTSGSARGRRAAPPALTPDGDHDAVADERDRWRAEALRLREAGLRMAAAFDALTEAGQHRSAAVQQILAAAESLDTALKKAQEATDHQNHALREFMIPVDMSEN